MHAPVPYHRHLPAISSNEAFSAFAGPGGLCSGPPPMIYTVAIMNQEAIAMVCGNGFTQLLERPWRRGMRGHIDVKKSAVGVFDNHKDIEPTEGYRHRHAEVTGHDGLGMIAHKRRPGLRRHACAWTGSQEFRHLFPYGAWRDAQSQLEQQFIGDTLFGPTSDSHGSSGGQGLAALARSIVQVEISISRTGEIFGDAGG